MIHACLVSTYHLRRGPVQHHAAVIQPDSPLAKPWEHTQTVRREYHDAGPLHQALHTGTGPLDEGRIASSHDLVEQEDLRVDRCRGGKGQTEQHPGGIAAYR